MCLLCATLDVWCSVASAAVVGATMVGAATVGSAVVYDDIESCQLDALAHNLFPPAPPSSSLSGILKSELSELVGAMPEVARELLAGSVANKPAPSALLCSALPLTLSIVSSQIGGGVGMLFGHPLDTIKVRMQRSPASYTSMLDCCRKTVRAEGVRGPLKGLAPPLLSISCYQAVCFASFSTALVAVTDKTENEASMGSLFVAGCMSGAATVFVTTPTDLLKVRLQLDTKGSGGLRQMLQCAKQVLASEGPMGFYRGMTATAMRDTPSTGVYFVTYHLAKRRLGEWLPKSKKDSPMLELTAGGVAGVLAWGSVVPFDVVKTRLQSDSSPGVTRSFAGTLKNIVEKEGWRTLYAGAAPLLVRAFFVNAVTFYAYEEAWRQSVHLF